MWLTWMEYALVLLLMTALAVPMGQWLARCFTSEHHAWIERLSFRALGVNPAERIDRKSTRLNSSHLVISYAVFCLKKKQHNPYGGDASQNNPPGELKRLSIFAHPHPRYQHPQTYTNKMCLNVYPFHLHASTHHHQPD